MRRDEKKRTVRRNGKRSDAPVRSSPVRRALYAAVAVFVAAGVAAIVLLMSSILPKTYARQAKETILPALQTAQKDDILRFGVYEQDGKRDDGAEEIEWTVLARKEDRLLLISRYALDCVCWDNAKELITWDRSTIREWLNQTFYDDAFNGAEKRLILKSDVEEAVNPNFPNVDQGAPTQDKVFLLGIEEAFRYFGTDPVNRQCLPTPYARSCGAKVDTKAGYCVWWLRSLGFDQSVASRIQSDGSVNYCGYHVFSEFNAVRPCIWVTLTLDTASD